MPNIKNNVIKEPKTFRKKKIKKEQLHNIISMRISDDERKRLEKLTKTTSKSISAIMREAMELWSTCKRRNLCTD